MEGNVAKRDVSVRCAIAVAAEAPMLQPMENPPAKRALAALDQPAPTAPIAPSRISARVRWLV